MDIEVDNIPFFFIIGKGRSGTTLLQNLLDANPVLQVPPESTFIIHLFPKYKKKTWDMQTVHQFIDDLYKFRLFKRDWNIDKQTLLNNFTKTLKRTETFSFATAVKVVYLSYPSIYPKSKIISIGDKNPFYTFYIEELKEIFPDAKFIHILRDPRANTRSHILAFNNKNISFIAYKWLIYNLEIEKHKQKEPKRYFTLTHESLTNRPKENLKQLCDFLNVKFCEKSLNYKEMATKAAWEKETFQTGIHQQILKPIDPGVNEKWKTFFSSEELQLIQQITSELAKKYGYFEFSDVKNSTKKNPSQFLGKLYFKSWLKAVRLFYGSPFFVKRFAFTLLRLRNR